MSASQIEASNSGNVASPTLAMDLRASANGCTAAMSTGRQDAEKKSSIGGLSAFARIFG